MIDNGRKDLLEFMTDVVYRDILDCIGIHLLG